MNKPGLSHSVLISALICVVLTACGLQQGGLDQAHMDSPENASISAGKTIVVTSAEDSGPGTLRQALIDANTGDIINFDTEVFSPDQPGVIYLQQTLPIVKSNLTIDAGGAGVILDGSQIPEIMNVVFIVSSNNVVSGLIMRNFCGMAIHISGGQNNTIRGNVLGGSDGGVGLWGGASNNVIAENYIGVSADGVTPLGNRGGGIFFDEVAHDNQIGPNNTIAFNDECGICFAPGDGEIIGNAISQNSIHDNGYRGIAAYGSNNDLDAPVLFEFDLQAGTLTGAACPQCIVEVFSDCSNEGAFYEGQVVADENGMFAYENGTAFQGPFLTATATDPAGNTSIFSAGTSGSYRSSVLQEGNTGPIVRISILPYQELADNRMSAFNILDGRNAGGGIWDAEQLAASWFRGSLDPMEWEAAVRDDWYSQSSISEDQDRAISLLAESGTTIVYVLMHFDESLHAQRAPDYGNEEEVQLFLDYTHMLVSHFKGRIPYYEILNEAVAYVEVEDYINLIHRMIPVIREADPQARIVVGGATDLKWDYSREFLFEVLQSDVMPLVDVIGFHPLYGQSPGWEETREYYYNYPALVQEIRDTATAHGFKGEYVVSEMVWRTPANPNLAEQPSEYTGTVAAKYTARAIVINLGMDVVAGTSGATEGPRIVTDTVHNLGNIMAGARASELPGLLQSDHSDFVSYGFSLPNSETLIALWIDGAAVDEDPGEASTLTLIGCAGQTAAGIDVLYGFEQDLVTSSEDGNLIIRDFLIRDYPILIRLSN